MIVDGQNLILGRLASYVAKKALLGENIEIVNCEKIVITGNKEMILKKFKRKREMGEPFHGPFYPRNPRDIVRRTIRGMLSYKQSKGRDAYKKVMCYTGVPEKFKGKNFENLEEINISKIKKGKYISIEEISKWLGHG